MPFAIPIKQLINDFKFYLKFCYYRKCFITFNIVETKRVMSQVIRSVLEVEFPSGKLPEFITIT